MLTAGSPHDQLMLMDLLSIYNIINRLYTGLTCKKAQYLQIKKKTIPIILNHYGKAQTHLFQIKIGRLTADFIPILLVPNTQHSRPSK